MANGVNHARAAAVPAGVERVRKALREQGSGVLTQIDVRQTLRAKPNTDVAGHSVLDGRRAVANPSSNGEDLGRVESDDVR